jgi:hypothetical protein
MKASRSNWGLIPKKHFKSCADVLKMGFWKQRDESQIRDTSILREIVLS